MAYIEVPVEAEPVELADQAFGYLESKVPGWLPSPGNLEAWLIEALALIAGELRAMTALVPDTIFAYFGESIVGIPPVPATAAIGSTTWVSRDTVANNWIDAGTLVGITPAGSQTTYAFQVLQPFELAPGATVAGIEVMALQPGAAANGIMGEAVLIDQIDFVESVVLEQATSGGTDAETIDAYLGRLSDLFTLLTPRPILPEDFALMAVRSQPSIARATAIDLLNPVTGETNCPRCVTVAIADANGQPLPAQIKADVDALLQEQREVNFLTFVIDPSYEAIDVDVDVVAYPGYPADVVTAELEAQLASYLSPAAWGVPPYGDPGTSSWLNVSVVRYLEVAEHVNRADGVSYITDLKIRKAGGSWGTADLVLSGYAPLPSAGTITVAVALP